MVRAFLLGCGLLSLSGCQILSGLADYEASEIDTPPPEATPFGKSFGGADIDSLAGAAIGPDGTIVIGGTMANVDFGSGSSLVTYGRYDPFLAKLDGSGNHLASVSFGAPDGDLMLDMALGPDGRVAVVGLFRSTMSFGGLEITGTTATPDPETQAPISVFVATFDASLRVEWAVALSTFEALVSLEVAFDPSGNVVVAGTHDGLVDFLGDPRQSSSRHDLFVLGLDRQGDKRWLRTYPAAVGVGALPAEVTNAPAGLAVDANGSAYVAIHQFRGLEYATGTGTDDPNGEIVLLKIDAVGNESWVGFYGGLLGFHAPTALTVDLAGRPVLAGLFFGQYTASDQTFTSEDAISSFVSRFSANGEHLTTTVFPGPAFVNDPPPPSVVTSLEAAGDGTFIGTGVLYDELTVGETKLENTSSTANYDVLLLRLDAALAPTLAKRYGDASRDAGVWAGLHPSGRVVATGQFEGQLRFADYDFSSAGESDLFVVHYDP